MIRKINNRTSDYRNLIHEETEFDLVLLIEYGESNDNIRFYVKEIFLTIDKEGKTTYPELQELVDQKLKEFENGSLLD